LSWKILEKLKRIINKVRKGTQFKAVPHSIPFSSFIHSLSLESKGVLPFERERECVHDTHWCILANNSLLLNRTILIVVLVQSSLWLGQRISHCFTWPTQNKEKHDAHRSITINFSLINNHTLIYIKTYI